MFGKDCDIAGSVVYVNRNIRHLAQDKAKLVIEFSKTFYLSAKEVVHKRRWQIAGGGVKNP